MGEHGFAENHAVLELLLCNATLRFGRALAVIAGIFARLRITTEVRMALWAKPVEGAAHVRLLLCCHVEERQVEGGAARMTALQTDVVLREEHALVEVGIEVVLHQRVSYVLRPAHEVVNTFLRTIGIVDFQPITQLNYVIAHGLQAVCSLTGKQCRRLLVAVNARSHEVVCAVVANLQDGIGHHVGEGYKLAGIVRRADCRVIVVAARGQHRCAADYEDSGDGCVTKNRA